ncbi:MAG: FAD-dependent oxidoreductase [Actinomycetota bacterium]|nr:FAD-dependent oxidoreductase [Actinomycetota bacterium]
MRVDVVVVGAGPAGCSAAYHAARAGSRCCCWTSTSPARTGPTGMPCSRVWSRSCR